MENLDYLFNDHRIYINIKKLYISIYLKCLQLQLFYK